MTAVAAMLALNFELHCETTHAGVVHLMPESTGTELLRLVLQSQPELQSTIADSPEVDAVLWGKQGSRSGPLWWSKGSQMGL